AGFLKQRQALGRTLLVERAHGPKGGAAVEPNRTEGVGICKPLDRRPGQAGAQPEIAHGTIAFAAVFDEQFGVILGKTFNAVEAESHGFAGADYTLHFAMTGMDAVGIEGALLQVGIPGGMIDVRLADGDTV